MTPDASAFGEKWRRIGRWSNYTAVLFNSLFAILAITTLAGMAIITRPQQVLHDIQPWMWLPLLIIIAPAQLQSQNWAWRTILLGGGRQRGRLLPLVGATWRLAAENVCFGVN